MQGPRGKGGRRRPWRDGGLGPLRESRWRRQARHAVANVEELGEKTASVELISREPPERSIYKLDQVAAHQGFAYYAELEHCTINVTLFKILVSSTDEDLARKAIERLNAAAAV